MKPGQTDIKKKALLLLQDSTKILEKTKLRQFHHFSRQFQQFSKTVLLVNVKSVSTLR
jgi:hypothetical protein